MVRNHIALNNKKERAALIATAGVTVMLVLSIATIGSAPFSVQQRPGGGPPGQQVTSENIVDGEVRNQDLADDAVTSEKIRDGEVTADDLDPSLIGGVPGGGFELQVTERSNTIELPRTRGEFTVTVQCNPDEVVTGGGFAASLSPQFTAPTGIPKESRMDASQNGWEVHWDVAGVDASSAPQFAPAQVQVFAECLKVVDEETTG